MIKKLKKIKPKKPGSRAKLKSSLTDFFYHSKFKDRVFVLKASGKLITDTAALENIARNIRQLSQHGIKTLLVYGGGQPMDEAAAAAGHTPEKIQGRRVTREKDLEIAQQVLAGDLSFRLSQAFHTAEVAGLSLNGLPHDWVTIERRPEEPIDYGYVGDIHGVNANRILSAFKSAAVVAIPCLGISQDGEVLNINADTIATELALGLKAYKLVFLSDVDGVKREDHIISVLNRTDTQALIDQGVAKDGMRVKLENTLRALDGGVNRIHILNGFQENSLMDEFFTLSGVGTMILSDKEKEIYESELRYGDRQQNA